MRRNFLLRLFLASIPGILVSACNGNSNAPSKVGVDRDIVVAIYSTSDSKGLADTVSHCLLEEKVHVSELLHYSNEEGLTMPFNLSDTAKYAEVTESNLDKRIAISVNGNVISTPVVKMKIDNGACSVVLDMAQAAALFPEVDIEDFGGGVH